MTIISQDKRYLPHEITTTVNSVKLYRQTNDISFVCRRYRISKASLMRWNKQYDGTKESLTNKAHHPHSPHPNAHTEQELTWIRNYHRRNPNSSICELYGKLREEKRTAVIQAPCTESLSGSATARRRNRPRRNRNTRAIMILPLSWA